MYDVVFLFGSSISHCSMSLEDPPASIPCAPPLIHAMSMAMSILIIMKRKLSEGAAMHNEKTAQETNRRRHILCHKGHKDLHTLAVGFHLFKPTENINALV